MIPQAYAAQAVGKDIKKGDSGTVMPVINIVNKQAKWGVYITLGVVGVVLVYYGGRAVVWNIEKSKADKLSEADNAKRMFRFLDPIVFHSIWSYLNPLNFGATAIEDAGKVVVSKIKDFISDSNDNNFVELSTAPVYNVAELIKAYLWLYRRDLLKDLKSALSDENYNTLIKHWQSVDINKTGVGYYDKGGIAVKTGKKVTNYTVGNNPAYADKYGLIVKKGAAKYVTMASGVQNVKDFTVNKGDYAGISKGFSLAGTAYNGGIVFQDKSGVAGLYMVTKVNGSDIIIVVPIDNVLLFESYTEMNAYANGEGLTVNNIKI